METEFVVVVGTPELLDKYKPPTSDAVVAAELRLIDLRIQKPSQYGWSVVPLLLAGESSTSFTPQLQELVQVDFRDDGFYFVKLFDLIWRIHGLPFDNPLLDDLRQSMSPAPMR
jgi:hypothetical protein